MAEKLTSEKIEEISGRLISHYQVSDDLEIGRYMSFPKFMSLITNKRIFFTRADNFEDPLEGEMPIQVVKKLSERNELLNIDKFYRALTNKNFDFKEYIEGLNRHYSEMRKHSFISCWTIFNSESYALWKIYAADNGVAIKTNVKKLRELFKSYSIELLKVDYLSDSDEKDLVVPRFNNGKSLFNRDNYFVCEKREYSFENEVRAIIHDPNIDSFLLDVSDLSEFIEEVYVSPFAENWYIEVIDKTLKKFELGNIPVIQSGIVLNK